MSKFTNDDCFLLLMFLNQLMASEVFFHWFTFVLLSRGLLSLSKIHLLILPISDFDGLISINDGEFGNRSLRSFTTIKTSVSCNCWILSSNFSFLAIFFASEFILLTLFLLVFYRFWLYYL